MWSAVKSTVLTMLTIYGYGIIVQPFSLSFWVLNPIIITKFTLVKHAPTSHKT